MGTRILSVEDDERIRTAVRLALEDEGWTVDEAGTGEEALARFEQAPTDVVLIDIMLPDINGKEVCQRVRSDKTMDDVRIICISGMVEDDKVDELKAAGANDFLQKPFDVETLLEHICRLLDIEVIAAK